MSHLAFKAVQAAGASQSYMPAMVSFVQEVAQGKSALSGTNFSGTVLATAPVGDTLIMRYFGNAALTGVTDSKGNTWQIDSVQTASQYLCLASCNITTALLAGDMITATIASGTAYHGFVVDQWHNLHQTAWFGGVSGMTSVTSTARSATSVAAISGSLVLGIWGSATSADAAWTPGTGFTSFNTPVFTTAGNYLVEGEYQVTASAGSVAPIATGTSQRAIGYAAYYKAAPA